MVMWLKFTAPMHKHWGELKGFALALETGGVNLGETGVKMNRLLGYSPVLLGNTQVAALVDGEICAKFIGESVRVSSADD